MRYTPLHRLSYTPVSGMAPDGTLVLSDNVVTITLTTTITTGRVDLRYKRANDSSAFATLSTNVNPTAGSILSGTLTRGSLYVLKLVNAGGPFFSERDGRYYFVNIPSATVAETPTVASPPKSTSHKYRITNISKLELRINIDGVIHKLRPAVTQIFSVSNVNKTNIVGLSESKLITAMRI